MSSKGYTATKKSTTRYEFVSIGPKGKITKRIEFAPLRKRGYYNLAFGDVLKDGKVNDAIYSNNQDIVKVIATVIETVEDFLKENATAKVVFTGSSDNRTAFYHKILSRHYQNFSARYIISGLVEDAKGIAEIEFDPTSRTVYLAFLVRNKI